MMFRAKHVLQNKEGRFYFINFLYIYTFLVPKIPMPIILERGVGRI